MRTRAQSIGFFLGGFPTAVLAVVLVSSVGMFCSASPEFRSLNTLNSILLFSSWIGVIAVGTAVALAAGSIDFSIMSVAALSGIIAARLDVAVSPWLGISAGIAAGVAVGVVNGIVVVFFDVNPFLATLATGGFLRGLDYTLGNGTEGWPATDSALVWVDTSWGPVPYAFMFLFAAMVVAAWVMRHHLFGRRLLTTGGNPVAARLGGLRPRRARVGAYMISGGAAATGGIILAAELGAGIPAAGLNQELTLFSAVLIGGTSLWGGSSNVIGAVIAIAFLQTLYTGLVLTHHSSNLQPIIAGVLLLGSVWLVQQRARRRSRAVPSQDGATVVAGR